LDGKMKSNISINLVIGFQSEEKGFSRSFKMFRKLWRIRQECSEDGSGQITHDQDDGAFDLGQVPHQRIQRESVLKSMKMIILLPLLQKRTFDSLQFF